jgi:hypothetical protein
MNINAIYNSNPKVNKKVDLMNDLNFDDRLELFDFKKKVNMIHKTMETQPSFTPQLKQKKMFEQIKSKVKQSMASKSIRASSRQSNSVNSVSQTSRKKKHRGYNSEQPGKTRN